VLLILLILILYGKMQVVFTNKIYPNYFGYTFFEVASGSMEPALYKSDVIVVKISKDNLNVNDIIAFEADNTIITHRIVFIDNDMLTVKGDNNNTIDRPININTVIGKVVKVYEKLGVWKKVFTEPKILIALFVTLLLIDFALSYDGNENKVKKKKEKKKENDNEKDIVKIKQIDGNENSMIEKEQLLEFTRKIDIDDINVLLKEKDNKIDNNIEKKQLSKLSGDKNIEDINALLKEANIKLSKDEIRDLRKKIENVLVSDNSELELNKKEKDFIEYTMRLDLDEIRKSIKKDLNR